MAGPCAPRAFARRHIPSRRVNASTGAAPDGMSSSCTRGAHPDDDGDATTGAWSDWSARASLAESMLAKAVSGRTPFTLLTDINEPIIMDATSLVIVDDNDDVVDVCTDCRRMHKHADTHTQKKWSAMMAKIWFTWSLNNNNGLQWPRHASLPVLPLPPHTPPTMHTEKKERLALSR